MDKSKFSPNKKYIVNESRAFDTIRLMEFHLLEAAVRYAEEMAGLFSEKCFELRGEDLILLKLFGGRD